LQKLLQTSRPGQQQQQQQQQQSQSGGGDSSVRAVILVPTRELCTQVADVLTSLIYYCDHHRDYGNNKEAVVKIAVLSMGRRGGGGGGGGGRGGGGGGGEKALQEMQRQQALLRDAPNVIVATPGGLMLHLRNGDIATLQHVETFCIDEADLVLSTFGYANDVAEIVKALPRICQGFLLSATLSPELESLKKIVLHSPVVLKLEQEDIDHHHFGGQAGSASSSSSSSQQQQLKQFYLTVKNKNDKNLVIYVFLKLGLLQGKGLFFVNTTDAGYRLKLLLEQFHVRSAVLNAELPFRSRLNIIEQFNYGNFDYLIATDASTDAAPLPAPAAPTASNKEKNDNDDKEASDDDDDDDDHDEEIHDNNKDEKKSSGSRQQQQQQQRQRKKDAEYGVARGLDFRNVSFVVNVDFPPNARSYAHRVGRTARGGARGVALSLVQADVPEQYETLLTVQQDQPPLLPVLLAGGASTGPLQAAAPGEGGGGGGGVSAAGIQSAAALASPLMEQPQPTPLDFDLKEIEGFRYRVEDVSRAVTRIAVQEARAAELKAEILNSERLQSHFEDNPADLQLLRHDRLATAGGSRRVLEHLKHVPKYLLPRGAQVAKLNKKRKKRRHKNSTGGARRTDNDPLQSFSAQGNAGAAGAAGAGADEQEQGEDPFAEFMEDGDDDDNDDDDDNEGASAKKKKKQKTQDSRIFANARDGTGESTAGRNLWKEKHRKGKFSKKKRNGKGRRGEPLGI
jgi:ATP-dependent RNA helicase DDX56/DBP9